VKIEDFDISSKRQVAVAMRLHMPMPCWKNSIALSRPSNMMSFYGSCLRRAGSDFRGRILEAILADAFVRQKIDLRFGVKQGGKGDVDFCWQVMNHQIFIEMKLWSGSSTRSSINNQLQAVGESSTIITDDTRDIGRIQLDLFQKSSTTKFDSKPQAKWINLIGIDISELQLGTADLCDCLLAAGGNTVASRHCDESTLRPDVVGIFEKLKSLSVKQQQWIEHLHKSPKGSAHPRDYIHGALFLFRDPSETAALSYALSTVLVWNSSMITTEVATPIAQALFKVIPRVK
jgi:hypothetical protein